jgi:hypothetical protein
MEDAGSLTETAWLESGAPYILLAFLELASGRWPISWFSPSGTQSVTIPPEEMARKERLLACACCRRIWRHLDDQRSRRMVAVAELYADTRATQEELVAAKATAELAVREVVQTARGTSWGARAAWKVFDWLDGEAGPLMLVPVVGFLLSDAFWNRLGATWPKRAAVAARSAALATGASPLALEWLFGYARGAIAWTVPARARESVAVAEERWQASLVREVFGNPFRPVTVRHEWLTAQGALVPTIARCIYEERAFDQLPVLADALEDVRCDEEAILSHCREPGEHVLGCWALDLLRGER